jgi:hypothetical protein
VSTNLARGEKRYFWSHAASEMKSTDEQEELILITPREVSSKEKRRRHHGLNFTDTRPKFCAKILFVSLAIQSGWRLSRGQKCL